MEINLAKPAGDLATMNSRYAGAAPFPHIVIDDFLPPDVAAEAHSVFPGVGDEGWIHYLHYNEKKHGLNKMKMLPPVFQSIIEVLNGPAFLESISRLTGIRGLMSDESLEGGGLHQSERGGFLNIHADFTVHPHHKHWQRRVNLLIYLNPGWDPRYGGELELWDRDMKACVRKISPVINRCVIFNTDLDSFHGFPEPIKCPEGVTRKSLALYYYTAELEKPKKVPTNYMGRPDDGARKIFIWTDKKLLWAYNAVKGWMNINDDFASKWLKRLSGKK